MDVQSRHSFIGQRFAVLLCLGVVSNKNSQFADFSYMKNVFSQNFLMTLGDCTGRVVQVAGFSLCRFVLTVFRCISAMRCDFTDC